jgi:mannose-6-phosphate isomerase-like protein (cupin superfamily)
MYNPGDGNYMKHYEKIKKIRIDLNLTVKDVYGRGAAILGPQKAISISTINRIEAGKPHKFSSLVTLCFILGITINELFKGTEFEECLIIRRKERTSGYQFNDEASSSIINNPNQNFLVQEFLLVSGGETSMDRAPQNRGKYEKMVYVISGHLVCVLDSQELVLKSGDTISFDSTKPHYFKNTSGKKCKFLAVENPGRY